MQVFFSFSSIKTSRPTVTVQALDFLHNQSMIRNF